MYRRFYKPIILEELPRFGIPVSLEFVETTLGPPEAGSNHPWRVLSEWFVLALVLKVYR